MKFNVRIAAALALALLAIVSFLAPVPDVTAQRPHRSTMLRNDGVEIKTRTFSRPFTPSLRPSLPAPAPTTVNSRHLSPITVKGNSESIIGTDERVQVTDTAAYPNSAIVYLEIEFPQGAGSCSGWMIGPHTLATAGHCVYMSALGGWATSIQVYPGRSGNVTPFGSFSATQWYVKKKWTKKEKPKFDFAAVNLATDIAATVGTFGFAYNDDNSFWTEYPLTVRGYPGEKPTATLWTMDGAIGSINKTRTFYAIDTSGGQSGSPAFGILGAECDPCGFGIHTYGTSSAWTLNSATRITGSVFNFLNSVILQP